MYESDDEQSKREFYYHESNNNKNNNIETADFVTTILNAIRTYICKVCCLKKSYNKPLINLDCLVITGKYQTSVFYVCQDLGLIFSHNNRILG